MKLTHQISLTAGDIQKAVERYVRSKSPPDWDFEVQIQWRAQKAIVLARRPIPVLTDSIEGHTA
ncbi:MAG: hypothetical protein ACRD9W_28255 [Terriglobia bacterium]